VQTTKTISPLPPATPSTSHEDCNATEAHALGNRNMREQWGGQKTKGVGGCGTSTGFIRWFHPLVSSAGFIRTGFIRWFHPTGFIRTGFIRWFHPHWFHPKTRFG